MASKRRRTYYELERDFSALSKYVDTIFNDASEMQNKIDELQNLLFKKEQEIIRLANICGDKAYPKKKRKRTIKELFDDL